MGVSLLLALYVASPAAASMPGPPAPGTPVYTDPNAPPRQNPAQDAAWLVKKHPFQIPRPGMTYPSTSLPAVYNLPARVVSTTIEPSANYYDGYLGNFDDAGQTYHNKNMVNLCVPGALTNALYYWGSPIASYGKHQFTDLSVLNNPQSGMTLKTYWDDFSNNDHPQLLHTGAHRSYMMYLAWLSNPGGLRPANYTGVMDAQSFPSTGATLQTELSVANWEASGHNVNDYINFFYTINWHYDYHLNPSGGTDQVRNVL